MSSPAKKWEFKRPAFQAALVEFKELDPGFLQLICDMRDILDEEFNPEIIENSQV